MSALVTRFTTVRTQNGKLCVYAECNNSGGDTANVDLVAAPGIGKALLIRRITAQRTDAVEDSRFLLLAQSESIETNFDVLHLVDTTERTRTYLDPLVLEDNRALVGRMQDGLLVSVLIEGEIIDQHRRR